MNAISIIGCIIGIITCVIGIATFTSAQITKAKQDGMLIAKIDQCVQGIGEIKSDMKEKNHELDCIIDKHSKDIVQLKVEVDNIKKMLEVK